MVFLFVDMFDNLSLPICHISSFTQHGFTMSESLETQRQGGFSTCVLKVFKVMRVAFFFFYHSKVMMPRNVRDAHRQSRGALPLLVRGRWLKHWVPNTAELAVARSCWHGCRDPSPVFITTVLNVVSLLFIYFFHFTTVTSTVILQDRDRKTGWERMRDFGQTLLLYLFIYVGNYFLSVQQAVLSKTCCPLARRTFQCSVEVPEFPFFRNINLPNEWCPHYNTDYKSNQITESRVSK